MAAYMHATCACIKDISVNTQTKGLTLLCVVMPTDATSKRKETPKGGFRNNQQRQLSHNCRSNAT